MWWDATLNPLYIHIVPPPQLSKTNAILYSCGGTFPKNMGFPLCPTNISPCQHISPSIHLSISASIPQPHHLHRKQLLDNEKEHAGLGARLARAAKPRPATWRQPNPMLREACCQAVADRCRCRGRPIGSIPSVAVFYPEFVVSKSPAPKIRYKAESSGRGRLQPPASSHKNGTFSRK